MLSFGLLWLEVGSQVLAYATVIPGAVSTLQTGAECK